jgi:membrane-bound lytic murein transglycosylase D
MLRRIVLMIGLVVGLTENPVLAQVRKNAGAGEISEISATASLLIEEALRRERENTVDAETEEQIAPVTTGVLPGVITSDVPLMAPETAEGKSNLEWLNGIRLPDFPIRWDDRVVRFLEYFRNSPTGRNVIRSWFARANRYGSMIREKLRDASLPEDLLYVAMVESEFNPTAHSDAGALGMWQFVPDTGDEYGLDRSRWVDQRMNPERSTAAAVQLLTDLQKRFNSWELTLAAFNMGYGATLRSISKYNTNDFWLLTRLEAGLPYETGVYIAKVMACAVIGRNPELFGLADLKPDPPITTTYVTVAGGTWIAPIARAIGITTNELTSINPELRRKRTPPDVKFWTLRIPAQKHAIFLRKWPTVRPPSRSTYAVRFGERINDVAQMFGTSVDTLRRLNELGPDDPVRPGTVLLVPDAAPSKAKSVDPAMVTVVDRSFSYSDRNRVFYRVASQDTLEEIASFFRVSLDEIRQWNAIEPSANLQRGMILQLFVPRAVDLRKALVMTPDEVKVLALCSDEFFSFHESQRDRIRIRYRVQAGDTVQRLAQRFDLSPGSIGRINGFSSHTSLRADQEIVIYIPKDQAASQQKLQSTQ